jgi:hypothetical protein
VSSTPLPTVGLLDPRTYVISLGLVTDLVVGTATFSVMVTLLAASAGLMITLLGIPLLWGSPVGVVAGTVTIAGWATAAAAVTAPAYVGFDDSRQQLAGLDKEGPVAAVASVLAGIALFMVMPTVVRNLARVQAMLVRRLLT